jgi:hypothetical protein
MMLQTLRGYVVGAVHNLPRVRLSNGVVTTILTLRQYKLGENLVLFYDGIRELITDSYTVSEWEALNSGADLNDAGPDTDEDEESPDMSMPEELWDEYGVFL